jgi:hypothetical protein
MPDGSAGIYTVFASQDLPQDALTKLQRQFKYSVRSLSVFSKASGNNLLADGALGSARNYVILNFIFVNLSLWLCIHRSLIQIGENSVMIPARRKPLCHGRAARRRKIL